MQPKASKLIEIPEDVEVLNFWLICSLVIFLVTLLKMFSLLHLWL